MVRESRPSARRPRGAGYVSSVQYASIGRDARFRLLKARFVRFAVTMIALFLGWYLLYVLLSAFARGFMARQVAGNINVALLLGVLQFASTFLLAWCYARYARRLLDPLSAQIRAEADRGLTARRLPPTRLRPMLGTGERAQPVQEAPPPPVPPFPQAPPSPPQGLGYGPGMQLGGLG